MTDLRPEMGWGYGKPEPREAVLRKTYKSVARRRTLIRGKLDDGNQHCAIGCLATDWNPKGGVTMATTVANEISAVNDKLGPRASPKQRWAYVMRWLRKEIAKLDSALKIGANDG